MKFNKSMKYLLLPVFIALSIMVQAKTYYFSVSSGSDSYSEEQAQSQATPWQTISKLNSIMGILKPGDSVLFKRGDRFPGTVIVGASGSAGNPIVFGAYGSETSKPLLDNRLELTGWINIGGNIWEATSISMNGQPTALMINDVMQPLGRYPNIDAPNRGYLSVTTHPAGSKTEFTDINLASTPDWTGAEVVMRTTRWTLERRTVATHLGQTIKLDTNTKYEIIDKFGYFFQNHPAALDTEGEWCYLVSGKKIQIYSATDPNTKIIKIANTDYCFDINEKSYLVIEGLVMFGAKRSNLNISKSTYIAVRNCDFLASGTNAINIGPFWGTASDSITISNNTFTNTQSNCINAGGKRIRITDNTIKNTALVPGMAESGQYGLAINTLADGLLIKRNVMDSIGYSGIGFLWSNNVEIAENVINHFCLVTDDGGGIYCWASETSPVQTNRKIINNLVLNGVGAPEGTNSISVEAEGIYIDGLSSNVDIIDNTVAFCMNSGIYLHNAQKIKVKKNTVFGCGTALWMKQDITEFPIIDCDIQNNLLVANSPDPVKSLLSYQIKDETSITKLGTLNNNIYCQPFSKYDYIKHRVTSPSDIRLSINLADWQIYSGRDLQSLISPRRFSLFGTLLSSNEVNNGTFNTNISGWSRHNAAGTSSQISWVDGLLDGGSLSYTVTKGTVNSGRIMTKLSEITLGKSYLLKLSTKATVSGSISCYLYQNEPPYKAGSAFYTINVGTTREEHEIVFTATASILASLFIVQGPEDGTVYYDNVEFYEVEALSPNEFIRFEYNTNAVTRTITTDKNYITPTGISYGSGSSISIPAFSSVVLLKEDIILGIEPEEEAKTQLFKLYPNPSDDKVYIISETGIIPNVATVYDLSGKAILQEQIRPGLPIDIGSFPKGIYVVRISSNKQTQPLKLIKH